MDTTTTTPPTPAQETQAQVLVSLVGTPYACSSLTLLSGGVANFVYEGKLVTPLSFKSTNGEVRMLETVVVKHTEGFSAGNRGFKFAVERCEYEQTMLHALSTFPPLEPPNTNLKVGTPRLLHFCPQTHTQMLTHLPSSLNLKSYLLTHPHLSHSASQDLGHALGTWLRRFHAWGAEDSEEGRGLREKMRGNTEMRRLKFTINHGLLVERVQAYPGVLRGFEEVLEKVVEREREEVEERERTRGGMLIHGDFWSGNIILPKTILTNTNTNNNDTVTPTTPETSIQVQVLDWELSHLGSPAYDLGQMAAELYCLLHFKGISAGEWILDGFLRGYRREDCDEVLDEGMRARVAIQAGIHLIVWGSRVPGWGSEEQVEAVVRVGREWIRCGWEGREGMLGLMGEVLGALV